MSTTRILLGAVPFGENNVGDEAILECIVHIMREAVPGVELVVSTNDPVATAKKFNLETVPLFGHARPYSEEELDRALSSVQAFVWAGATGLSDYPEQATALLRRAQAAGLTTILWGVGMNDALNPAHFAVYGTRGRVLATLTKVLGGRIDLVKRVESHRTQQARRRICDSVGAADLVVARDSPSREELIRCGVTKEVLVGADSAILLEADDIATVDVTEDVRALLANGSRKIGLCISAQRAIADRQALVSYLDRLVEDGANNILFIPMNPITDAELMTGLHAEMRQPERAALLGGTFEPSEIAAIAARMDVVVSSRLHLLIIAANSHVPIVGIARGSKVGNFLAPYGSAPVGSVDSCDFDELEAITRHWLAHGEEFRRRSIAVRNDMLERLTRCRSRLQSLLAQP